MKVKEQAARYSVKSKKYTYQDYQNLPDDGNRYEVINGELIMVAEPYMIHQIISGNIEDEIRAFLKNVPIGILIHSPVDVVLSNTNIVQPDIIFISRDNSNIIQEKNINGIPDLIIEILSPSTAYYDMLEKKEIYEKSGVKEYWIVDPKRESVAIFLNVNYSFELKQNIVAKGLAKSYVMKGFKVNIEKIFRLY